MKRDCMASAARGFPLAGTETFNLAIPLSIPDSVTTHRCPR
jgi:hypothetical protein